MLSHAIDKNRCVKTKFSMSDKMCRKDWLNLVVGAAALGSWAHKASALQSDEYVFVVEDGPIGLEIADLSRYRNELRVFVKHVFDGSAADASHAVTEGDILVSVNGVPLETMDARRAKDVIKSASRPCKLVLRKPEVFRELLGDMKEGEAVSTQVSPAVKGLGPNGQVMMVERLETPERCTRGARVGDLLAIEYAGYLLDGTLFDGSAVSVNGAGVGGRGGDTSIQFVLGQQPRGQFPPGWDVGLVGICVGEKRRLTVPAVLAYGAAVSVCGRRGLLEVFSYL
jgi:FK506-binding protein 2